MNRKRRFIKYLIYVILTALNMNLLAYAISNSKMELMGNLIVIQIIMAAIMYLDDIFNDKAKETQKEEYTK